MVKTLKYEIQHGDGYVGECNVHREGFHNRRQQVEKVVQREERCFQERIQGVADDKVQQCAQKENFRGGFQEFDEIFEGKNLFQLRHRIEFVEIRLDRFGCEEQSELEGVCKDAGEKNQQYQRQQNAYADREAGARRVLQSGRKRFVEKMRRNCGHFRKRLQKDIPPKSEVRKNHNQQCGRCNILTVGDLSLFTCVAQLFRRRLLGFFSHGRKSPTYLWVAKGRKVLK